MPPTLWVSPTSASGKRQVPGADVGLTHNVGGIGQYTFVHIFKKD